MTEEQNKEPISLIEVAEIACTVVGIGAFFVAAVLKARRNPLWDEIRKQPEITEDAEFEVVEDKKEVKLIEDKPNE